AFSWSASRRISFSSSEGSGGGGGLSLVSGGGGGGETVLTGSFTGSLTGDGSVFTGGGESLLGGFTSLVGGALWSGVVFPSVVVGFTSATEDSGVSLALPR